MNAFDVRLTPQARDLVVSSARLHGIKSPGLLVHRQGARGELIRTPSGTASWSIERPYAWHVDVRDFSFISETIEDLTIVEGFPVWLAFIRKPSEFGLVIGVRDGHLFADPLS